MKKIALVGGSATGKTTLLDRLEEEYKDNPDVVFVHESARQFFVEHPEEINFSLSVQERILDLVIANERIAIEKQPKLIVTDTSALEVVFYTRVHGDEKGATQLFEKVKNYIPTYDKFLLMNPVDVEFVNDAVRLEDKNTRDRIHQMIVDYYHTHQMQFELISGTIPERQKRVSDIIRTYLQNE
jgi:nicotinamide riboside kinase